METIVYTIIWVSVVTVLLYTVKYLFCAIAAIPKIIAGILTGIILLLVGLSGLIITVIFVYGMVVRMVT